MQKALCALLFVLTGACLTIGGIILANLFDDYKDSPESTYIETAAVPLTLAALFFLAGIVMLRKHPS